MEQLNNAVQTDAVLAGILALLVSDRQARHDDTEAILARAGLTEEEIRALTAPARVTPKPLPAWAGALATTPTRNG